VWVLWITICGFPMLNLFYAGFIEGGIGIGVLIYDIGACSPQGDVGGPGDDGLSAFVSWGIWCRFFRIEVALRSIKVD